MKDVYFYFANFNFCEIKITKQSQRLLLVVVKNIKLNSIKTEILYELLKPNITKQNFVTTKKEMKIYENATNTVKYYISSSINWKIVE